MTLFRAEHDALASQKQRRDRRMTFDNSHFGAPDVMRVLDAWKAVKRGRYWLFDEFAPIGSDRRNEAALRASTAAGGDKQREGIAYGVRLAPCGHIHNGSSHDLEGTQHMQNGNGKKPGLSPEALAVFIAAELLFIGVLGCFLAPIYVERGELPADVLPVIKFLTVTILVLGGAVVLACVVEISKKSRE